MSRRVQRSVSMVLALVFLVTGFASVAAYHEDDDAIHDWADPRFEDRWARTDLPVSTLAVARTWIWGPSPYTEGMMEPYEESPGGMRLVQYMDKSRMELNDPDIADTSIWVVTQGLLSLDMMEGRIQVGDAAFEMHSEGPSMENVAGDPGPDNGPTYATMGELMDEAARAEGTVITDWLSSDGMISSDGDLGDYGVTAAHHVQQDWIDHTVASVFWDFMNSEGLIWDGEYMEDNLFPNPYYAVGLPVTEAYWTNVMVGGDSKDVLVQCFERRCLTYAPSNPDGWKVEAGNVGQHYYRWLQTHDEEPEPPFDVLAEGLVQPRGATYTDHGVYVAEAGAGGDNCVTIEEEFEGETEEFELCAGYSGAVTLVDDEGQSRVVDELPSIIAHEDAVGAHDVAFDGEGNMYIAMGFGGPPEARALFGELGDYFATVVKVDTEGMLSIVADLGDYEETVNPDGSEEPDTNPYAIAWHDGGLVVVDAGGNSLLRVETDGSIETIAVFEDRIVPSPPFIPGDEMPMNSVPTNVVVGPDGYYYVSELTGFPFPVDAARVYQVTPDGDVEIYAEGFTNGIDLAFDSAGRLHVLELVAGGILNVDEEAIGGGDFSSAASQIVRVNEDGSLTHLEIPGLYAATGLAIGSMDEMYVVNLSLTPLAQLVQIDL